MPGELISREALERIISRAAALQASERSGTPEMAHRRCCGPRWIASAPLKKQSRRQAIC